MLSILIYIFIRSQHRALRWGLKMRKQTWIKWQFSQEESMNSAGCGCELNLLHPTSSPLKKQQELKPVRPEEFHVVLLYARLCSETPPAVTGGHPSGLWSTTGCLHKYNQCRMPFSGFTLLRNILHYSHWPVIWAEALTFCICWTLKPPPTRFFQFAFSYFTFSKNWKIIHFWVSC